RLDEAQEPGQCRRHVTPAQLQGRSAVEQHLRDLLQHAGQRKGHARGGAEAARIAKRGFLSRLALLDQPHREAYALEIKRATDADEAGAYHGVGSAHQFGENETVAGTSSPSLASASRMRRSLWPRRMFHSAQRFRNFCQRWSSSERSPM